TTQVPEEELAETSGRTAGRDLQTEAGETGGDTQTGRRGEELIDSLRAGPICSEGSTAGTATAVGPDILRAQPWISTGTVATSGGGTSAGTHSGGLSDRRGVYSGQVFRQSQPGQVVGR